MIGIHVARVGFLAVDAMGNVIDKESDSTTIGDVIKGSSHEHRVLADSGIPNTVNKPTVKAYLEAEAAGLGVATGQHVTQIGLVRPGLLVLSKRGPRARDQRNQSSDPASNDGLYHTLSFAMD